MDTSNRLTSRRAPFLYGAAVVAAAAIVGAALVWPRFSAEQQFPSYNVDRDNVAIHGYDTVAYFTAGEATKGSGEFEQVWEDARWRFASATNRELFKANPDRYAPQFGGYCALGLSAGEYADVDPEAWAIVDGKLYMIKTREFRTVWQKAPQAYLLTANVNWNHNRDQLRDGYGR